ncbi:MAG: glutamine synthetase family protein [Thermaerobacter sp.]|nr:glutamine synthetase family protein [Thermaerobacter sp.]
MPSQHAAPLTLERLQELAEVGDIDTVSVGFVDMQGRILGKRIPVGEFLETVLPAGMHFCNYLLGTDMDMGTPAGYRLMSWEDGYGDFTAIPDLSTLRVTPWLPGMALVLSDVCDGTGAPVAVSPRQILQRQIERIHGLGFDPVMATELEFYLWRETFDTAQEKGYAGLQPFGWYAEDYHLLQSTKAEPFYRQIRRQMREAGIQVISAKGETGPGQYEINLGHGPALATADQHAVYKHGVKEIAVAQERAVTFMAKPDDSLPGSSCHVHVSVVDRQTGVNAFPADGTGTGLSAVGRQFLAGQLALAREFTLLQAPTVNAYKRYASESWAPVNIAWAYDNRTCGLRVVGRGPGLHMENRLPGADANPYLTLAAILAAGAWGIEHEMECPPPLQGNAYSDPDLPRVPATLGAATELFLSSAAARTAFGAEVVEHYAHAARLEEAAFQRAVTSWERVRYFERI